MHSLNRILITSIVLLLATLASGKSSKIVASWKNPSYRGGQKFQRVLALGLSDKTAIRADFEDALAAELADAGFETIPGNTILLRPEGAQVDLNYIKGQIRENAIDTVVVSRLIKVETTVTHIRGIPYSAPFPYYHTFYGYYGTVYPIVYGPDYLKEEKKVRIETNLYVVSSQEGELVWTGITDTFNPSNPDKVIKGLVRLVVKQMRSDGALLARAKEPLCGTTSSARNQNAAVFRGITSSPLGHPPTIDQPSQGGSDPRVDTRRRA